MPSVACVFTLVLTSQAFLASAGVVRSGKVQSVGADGAVKPIKQHDHADSLMAMSVSASAQTEEIERPEMSNNEVRGMQVRDMLSDVEDMVRSGATPEPEKIRTIKSIVEDELVPDLKQTRDSAAKQVGINLAAIDACNSNAGARLQDIKATTEASVGQQRTEHANCREAEKEKHSTKNSKCTELDNFLNAIKVPADLPAGRPRDQMVQYVQTMSEYFCPKGPTCTTLDEACKLAEQEHAKHKGNCDRLQAAFELGFCTWRTELSDACAAHETCYESAVLLYNDHVSDTKELVKKWKVEYAALKKILCYCDVWLNDNNVKTADADQLNKCHGSSIDTSPMDIDFGTPADAAECSMAAVEKHPGTTDFVDAEYANFQDYVVDVVPCLPCEGETAAPPKPEPAPEPKEKTCKAVSTSTADAGYRDNYRGWYDVQGCGKCNDYCRWVGNSGPGGDPATKTEHGVSWWSCRAAGGSAPYTAKGTLPKWTFKKCAGAGGTPGECLPVSTSTADAGYRDNYRGWYDVQGCGKCNDYCRWVGNSGPGGDPTVKTEHGVSWWSCRVAGGSAPYSGKGTLPKWTFKRCAGEGATAP